MKLSNLNSSSFSPFGMLLKARPSEGEVTEETRTLTPSGEMEIYRCDSAVTIDYAEGMTALAVFGEGEPCFFYLDHIVQLRAGTRFSLLPLEQSAGVILLRPEGSVLEMVEVMPAPDAGNIPPRFAPKRIFTVFCQETPGDFYFRGEAHLAYELVYVEQGALHNIINGHDFVVASHDCIIIDSNQWHIQYSDLPVKFLTVSFTHTGDLSRTLTGRVIPVPAAVRLTLTKIIAEQADSPLSSEYLEALLQTVLIELIRKPDIHSPGTKAPATLFFENVLVDKALKMISDRLSEKISLKELANELHISVPYLYRLFDEHLKMPPGQYIMKIRLEESRVMLREGRKNISTVAAECGFTSIQHYSRQFRQHFQMSPSEYIRSLR